MTKTRKTISNETKVRVLRQQIQIGDEIKLELNEKWEDEFGFVVEVNEETVTMKYKKYSEIINLSEITYFWL